MSLGSPALAVFLPLVMGLLIPNLAFIRSAVLKISAHLQHCGRFLEQRAGDWVRLQCVMGSSVCHWAFVSVGAEIVLAASLYHRGHACASPRG